MLLLAVVLVAVNLAATLLLAREGSAFDRRIRIQGDLGRLVALVTTLEEVDDASAQSILRESSTGFTRFALSRGPLSPPGAPEDPPVAQVISDALAGREVRALTGGGQAGDARTALTMVSVRLQGGIHAGEWLTSLVYPLPSGTAWQWKFGFFMPLVMTLGAALVVGGLSIRRMTQPLRDLARAARAAGRGDRRATVPEAGAREIREAASAFNDMQRRIEDHDRQRMRLLAALGHDLRTPITSLRIRTEMLEDAALRDPMIATLEEMTVMADDLLHFGAGAQTGEALQETALRALLARLCARPGATLAAGAEIRMAVRPVSLARALSNLIDNALRYGGQARVSLIRDGAEVVFRVEDAGPGIPEARLGDVVEPFVRGEESRSAETGGTGLGLAITRNIALAHGGALRLQNLPQGGLCAELRLPAGA